MGTKHLSYCEFTSKCSQGAQYSFLLIRIKVSEGYSRFMHRTLSDSCAHLIRLLFLMIMNDVIDYKTSIKKCIILF